MRCATRPRECRGASRAAYSAGMTTRNETPWVLPLRGRDPREKHRASTPLELLFDLTFVVAISTAAAQLHHALTAAHGARSSAIR